MENGYQVMDKYPAEEQKTGIEDVLKKNGVIVNKRKVAMNPNASKLNRLVNSTRKPVNCIQSP